MSEYRKVEDDYGTLTQRISARGKYVDVSRTINDITFMLDGEKKTQDYLLALKAGDVQLRLNQMNDRMEIMGGLDDLPNEFLPITDILQANLLNWLKDIGLTGKDRMLDAVATASWRNQYHPIRDYLLHLKWDGRDHFSALMKHLTFSDRTKGIGQVFIKRWMIGAIAKVMKNEQNFMLVIDGAQGIGKSYLAKWLCPLPEFFMEGAIHPDDKDSYKRLMSYWIWEVGELEGTTRKSDRAALKDFISRRDVTIRLPYGKYDTSKPASASLLGTINEDGAGFLKDPTGSRRFAIVHLIDIDFNYVNIDVEQLWAQTFYLYQEGESWELQIEERMAQAAVNEEYEAESAVEQYFKKHYSIDLNSNGRKEGFIASIEILTNLKNAGMVGNDRANLMELSSILQREGLKKVRQGGLRGFYGIHETEALKVANLANLDWLD